MNENVGRLPDHVILSLTSASMKASSKGLPPYSKYECEVGVIPASTRKAPLHRLGRQNRTRFEVLP